MQERAKAKCGDSSPSQAQGQNDKRKTNKNQNKCGGPSTALRSGRDDGLKQATGRDDELLVGRGRRSSATANDNPPLAMELPRMGHPATAGPSAPPSLRSGSAQDDKSKKGA